MSGDISQSNLNLTAEEKRVFGQLFQEADPDGLGIITGEVAVRFLERTRLDPTILGVIWQIGDKENRGLLTPAGFSVVLRLIGHAQAGRDPSVELSKSPGPLPKFETISSSSGITTGPQPQGLSGPIRVPPLTPDKVSEYSSLFEKAGAQGGLLGGDAAREVFERARLPNEILGQIWNLADTDQKGALNVTDFVVAMHFLTSMRSGTMRALPQSLPAGLYEAATRGTSQLVAQSIPRSFSGNAPRRIQSPTSKPSGSPIAQQDTGSDWLVTPRDKAKFDEIFTGLDKSGQGYITGEQAVTFFGDSRLPEEVLAQIWDLSDINSEGRLTRDEFAVAMFLIRQERAQKVDNRGALPKSLPAQLVPPSMRQQAMPPSQTTAPAFDNARLASQQPKSAADDLFGLDALADNTSVPPDSATKGKESFSLPLPPASPTSSTLRAQGNSFKPFMPTSSFGQGLAAQNTGASSQSHQSQKPAPKDPGEDLLGDNDPEISQKLTSDTAELANMSNHITQLRTQMQDVQNKKTLSEQSLSNTTSQKKDLESRLAQIRTQYENEIREVKSLDDQLTTSRNETRKLQQELAMVEGAHQDLLSQHQQILALLEADQKENALLKQRLQELTLENTQLKTNMEKAKSDARQQKGMVAINKKQVTTTETENERLQIELNQSLRKNQEGHLPQTPDEQDSTVNPPRPVVLSPGGTNPFSRSSPHPSADGSSSAATYANTKPNPFDSLFGTQDLATAARPQSSSTLLDDTTRTNVLSSRRVTSSESDELTLKHSIQSGSSAATDSAQMVPSVSRYGKEMDHETLSNSVAEGDQPAVSTGISVVAGREYSQNDDVNTEHKKGDLLPRANADVPPVASNDQDYEQTSQTPALVGSNIPGAFPGEAPAESVPDPKGSNGVSSRVPASKDFDSTFPLRNSHGNASVAAAKTGIEFPPIQDVEQEESDSDADGGFEDDFSPASPQHSQKNMQPPHNGLKTRQDPAEAESRTDSKEVTDGSSQAEAPPAAGFQQSPPAYESAERRGSAGNSGRDSNQFPQQYHGLLPSREITNSPPDEIVQNTPQTITSVESDLPGDHDPKVKSAIQSTSSSFPGSSDATAAATDAAHGDDFEDAFDDLSDAQEEAEADFSEPATGEETEFNPTFASSSSGHNVSNGEHNKTKIGNDIKTQHATTQDNFTSFQPSSGALTNSTPQSVSTNDKSDWDAIFAGIDKPLATGESDVKSPFDTVGRSDNLLSARVAEGSPGASEIPTRPPVGRAISQGTEHDDPILKTLTNMGYPRELALKALEKYDYNLDKAADHLASKT